MDTNPNQMGRVHLAENGMCHCGVGHHHRIWRLLRVLIVLLLIVGAFHLGARVGSRGNFGEGRYSPGNMMMGHGGGEMMGWWGHDKEGNSSSTQIFGSITQISGPTITVVDNGGKSQTIVSQSNTVIVIGNQELPLASLKVGQTINAIGTLDKDGHLQAQAIQLAGL
jgi:hypothetical protein